MNGFLPPPDRDGLIRETMLLVAGSFAVILALAVVVYFLTG